MFRQPVEYPGSSGSQLPFGGNLGMAIAIASIAGRHRAEMPEAGETQVITTSGNSLATGSRSCSDVDHPSQVCMLLSVRPSTAKARTDEPKATRGARAFEY